MSCGLCYAAPFRAQQKSSPAAGEHPTCVVEHVVLQEVNGLIVLRRVAGLQRDGGGMEELDRSKNLLG